MNEYVDCTSKNEHTLQAIILCPTHEDVKLLKDEIKPLCSLRELYVTRVHGGLKISKKSIQTSDVIIACPGTFKYHCFDIDQSELKIIVLSQYDILLGTPDFLQDTIKCLKDLNVALSPNLHCLAISNTINIEGNMKTMPIFEDKICPLINRIFFKTEKTKYIPPRIIMESLNMRHYIIDARKNDSEKIINENINPLITKYPKEIDIPIFTATNDTVKKLTNHLKKLSNNNRDVIGFGKHVFGNIAKNEKFDKVSSKRKMKRHKEREKAFNKIQNNNKKIIVTTDVLSGTNHLKTDVLINFDIPNSIKLYYRRTINIINNQNDQLKNIYNIVKTDQDLEMINKIQTSGNINFKKYLLYKESINHDDNDQEIDEDYDLISNNKDVDNVDNLIQEQKYCDNVISDIHEKENYYDPKDRLCKVLKKYNINNDKEFNVDYEHNTLREIIIVYKKMVKMYQDNNNNNNGNAAILAILQDQMNKACKSMKHGFKLLFSTFCATIKNTEFSNNLDENKSWNEQNEAEVLKEYDNTIQKMESKLESIKSCMIVLKNMKDLYFECNPGHLIKQHLNTL